MPSYSHVGKCILRRQNSAQHRTGTTCEIHRSRPRMSVILILCKSTALVFVKEETPPTKFTFYLWVWISKMLSSRFFFSQNSHSILVEIKAIPFTIETSLLPSGCAAQKNRWFVYHMKFTGRTGLEWIDHQAPKSACWCARRVCSTSWQLGCKRIHILSV